MEQFIISEEKALLFHRAILSVAREHTNLIARARDELDRLRAKQPDREELWDRWAALLDMAVDDMSASILANTPDGGLLRAYSPLGGALSTQERNAIWQRIGLVQFIGFFLDAAEDLALKPAEQAGLTGIEEAVLADWAVAAPLELQKGALDKLKSVVSLQTSLKGLAPDRDVRRRWLRVDSETLGGTPLDLMLAGDMERVMEHLTGAVQITLGPENYPQM